MSEDEVRAELAKSRGKGILGEFRLQQITFVVPINASVAQYNARIAEANQLRARFRGCESGVQLARALRDVAVQPTVSRAAGSLPDEFLKLLERTPIGQLTPPQRGQSGVEMIAVCGKAGGTEQGSTASEQVRQELLDRRLKGKAEERYVDLRKRAVIVRRR